MQVKVRLAGFRGFPKPVTISIQLSEERGKIADVIKEAFKHLDIVVEEDEVLVICDDKMLYLDDEIPASCEELELYPLARGGLASVNAYIYNFSRISKSR
uniref:MoaD/ThiS family protein n=1 Tax=Ignisphaera aggregans TaxID=334771 RepID=A0A7C4FCU8_9CREN